MARPYELYADDSVGGREGITCGRPCKAIPQVARTAVSDLFFSTTNIEALQQGLRAGVYEKSRGQIVIGRQSQDELMIIMRSIYLEYGRNLPTNILEQVRALNARVLDFAVPRVSREAQMYLQYRVDSSSQLKPLEYGAATSRAGLRGGDGDNGLF